MNKHKSYFKRVFKPITYLFIFLFAFTTILAMPSFGVIRGIAFGFMSSISLTISFMILIFADYLLLKSKFKKYGNIDYGVKQKRRIMTKSKKDNIFDITINIMRRLKRVKKIEEKRDLGIVRVTTRVNCATLGEVVEISILERPENDTEVLITSEPRVRTNMIDYGRNYENVERIYKSLMEGLKGVRD